LQDYSEVIDHVVELSYFGIRFNGFGSRMGGFTVSGKKNAGKKSCGSQW
jgi:hypothetical protein